ncbi:helix-turn-helix transcriptional regulator [Achromobacter aloeverae]|uniref:HTH luxR-type domain-containing protein n=1 Tax=Achromobacter aloeverae TaxID=1750518 RepID=A0A4Q1HPQ7_9BURK|nr:helix-turn-helix transcriptional regulator [Achromobacter aloeverae]RXN92817.1 hypothetical protein C7R54_03485 [Achromobacter aloeverae]
MRNRDENADRLAPLLDLLYDAAVDDGKWRDIAGAIAATFSSSSAVLKTCGGAREPQLESVTDNLRIAPGERAWADYWHQNDLWVERSAQLKMGDVFTSQRLLTDVQFERTGFYQDWTRKLDIYHMVGVLFPVGKGEIGVLGVHRAKDAGPYGAADRHRLEALYLHVRRALGMRHRLHEIALAHHAAVDALERLDTGVMVVDASCTVLYANRAAEGLLRAAQGHRARDRRFCLDDPALNARLAKSVREAARIAEGQYHQYPRPGTAIAVPRTGRLPITLIVSPWKAEWAPADVARPAAMIFLRDPETSAPTAAQTSMELFGMTRAEATVAIAISQGASLESIAASLGVRLGTVPTHLKKALLKTGTQRQGALAALVARSVAGISTPR